MKKALLLFPFLLLLPFAALAQPAAIITSVSPSAGPSSGGNDVVVTGSGFATNIQCILPCPPFVIFGDVAVPAKEESDTRLVATAPAHAPGTVDITVALPDGRIGTAHNAYTFAAGAEDAWEKVLLPIHLDGAVPGSNGTRWKTDFWIRNNGDGPVQLAPWPCETEVCPAVVPLTSILESGFSLHNLPPFFREPRGGGNPSRLLFLSRNGASEVSMQLRVADESRAALNGGTELPVVRNSELLSGRAQLLNVPYDPAHFRLMLRIYDLTYTEAKFAVTLYAQETSEGSTREHVVELTATTDGETGDFRTQAAYVQYDFADLEKLPFFPDAFRIEVTPLTPGSRYYPLVSVTNNETQLITLVTPQ
jgi:hypothetical protein